ncbi:MAG: hypothetical protein JXA24_01730, partial [Proteobacteria bacterium]|nr:hypothetical protein [Pseudomonadota bacterium]
LIEVKGGSGEGFSWTHDMPEGFELVEYNIRSVQIKGDPTQAVAGEHHVTLTATDKCGDHGNASLSFKVIVQSSIESIIGPNVPLSDLSCTLPLTIKIVKNGEWNVDQIENNTISPELGSKGHVIEFKAFRGDRPARDVEWTWNSEVKDSAHCIDTVAYGYGVHTNENVVEFINNGVDGNAYSFHYTFVTGTTRAHPYECNNPGVGTAVLDEIPGVRYPKMTVNDTWRPVKQNLDGVLRLTGDFAYSGPLPVHKLRTKGQDDLSKLPREDLTVTAVDSCIKDGSASQQPAKLKAKFKLAYPDESLSKMLVYVYYSDAKDFDGSGIVSIHFQNSFRAYDDEDEGYFLFYQENSAATVKWGVSYSDPDKASDPDRHDAPKYQDACKGYECALTPKHAKVNDDSTQVDGVFSATEIILYMLEGGGTCHDTSSHSCDDWSNWVWPDFNLRRITFSSHYWEADFDDSKENVFNKNYDSNDDFCISKWTEEDGKFKSGMSKPSVRCDGDDCVKASVFHRRAFPHYE